MNKKIIIIVFSISLGIAILFISFLGKDSSPQKKNKQHLINNSSEEKQKNNLPINQPEIEKKEENKKEKEIISKKEKEKQPITVPKKNKENKLSLFIFGFIIGIIIVLIIVGIKIYQRSKKNKFDNFLEDNNSSSGSLDGPKENQTEAEERKKLFKCNIDYKFVCNTFNVFIVLLCQKLNNNTIEDVFFEDFNEQLPDEVTNKDFYKNIPNQHFRNILQAIINFLEKYITVQFLDEIYKNISINNDDYPILMEMSDQYYNADFIQNDTISLYKIETKLQKDEKSQEVTKEDIAKINNNQYFALYKDILHRNQATYFPKNDKKCFFFLKSFKFYKFFDQLFQELKKFMQNNKNQYEKTLTEMQIDQDNIEKLIVESD